MSAKVESFLARLYVDAGVRGQFLRDPLTTARQAGLSEWECVEMAKISPQELETAANSFERKRELKKRHRRLGNVRRFFSWIREHLE